jgi:spore coat protein U-like protein
MNMFRIALAATLLSGAGFASIASADTVGSSFQVQITIQKACDVTTIAPTNLNFGTHPSLDTNVTGTSTITVTCTPGTAYTIGLNAGLNPSTPGDITTRRMTDGSTHYVAYQLYQDVGHANPWGNTISTNTVAGTGTGSAQAATVYGLVASANSNAGNYNDTIAVLVTY